MTNNQEYASLSGVISSKTCSFNSLSNLEDVSLSGVISSVMTIKDGSVISGKPVAPTYTGSYNAPALFEPQSYPTRGFLMGDDFHVAAINYTEAQNEDGGITVTIGG